MFSIHTIMNIRIGNDIKVTFTIKGPAKTDTINMKSLRVYFVNSSSSECPFVKRFPSEPFPQFYTPSKYTVCGCGKYEYNTMPHYNKCEYAVCSEGFHDYHLWPSYNGFGITPKKFVDCCEPTLNDFTAPYILEEDTNKVSAYFPACMQKIGQYRMVVIITAYEAGWGKSNLHTYTIDYGQMFTITNDQTAISGNVEIDGDTKTIVGSDVQTITISSDTLYLRKGDRIKLGQKDRRDNVYDIHLTLTNGTTIPYRIGVLDNQKLDFITDEKYVKIDTEGTIEMIDIPEESVNLGIFVQNNEGVSKNITIMPISDDACYVGFDSTIDGSQIDANDDSKFKLFNSPNRPYTVTNPIHGQYLWIVSNTPVVSVSCGISQIPLVESKVPGFRYAYYCPNALINTSFDITINK